MIEILKENFYLGFWTGSFYNGDFLAVVWKTPKGPWEGKYRFRYYRDDKAHDSDDIKNWYAMKAMDGSDKTRDQLKDAMDTLLKVGHASEFMYSGCYVECMGDGDAMIELLTNADRPYLHAKRISKEEADQLISSD